MNRPVWFDIHTIYICSMGFHCRLSNRIGECLLCMRPGVFYDWLPSYMKGVHIKFPSFVVGRKRNLISLFLWKLWGMISPGDSIPVVAPSSLHKRVKVGGYRRQHDTDRWQCEIFFHGNHTLHRLQGDWWWPFTRPSVWNQSVATAFFSLPYLCFCIIYVHEGCLIVGLPTLR